MNVHSIYGADFSTTESLGRALLEQSDLLAQMAPGTAKARTVLACSSDRLKRALALAVADAKATSYADAEAKARSSTAYRDALDAMSAADEVAERAVAEWRAAEVKWESLRTLVSLEKAKASML